MYIETGSEFLLLTTCLQFIYLVISLMQIVIVYIE